jgi:hypothetical protein
MLEYAEIAPILKLRQQSDAEMAPISIEDLCEIEMQVGLAKMHNRLEAERRSHAFKNFVGYWPLAMGFLLACIAPALSELLSAFKPWGMGMIFPFVVLCGRPELHLSGPTSGMLQHFVLYAQFPVEALLAKSACKGRVGFFAVIARVAGFNLMGAVLLMLLNQGIG